MKNKFKVDKADGLLMAGVTGFIGTTILAIKSAKYDEYDKPFKRLSKKEKINRVKSLGKIYAPSICLGVASTAAIFFGAKNYKDKISGMTMLYGVASATAKGYADKIADEFGREKLAEIKKKLNDEKKEKKFGKLNQDHATLDIDIESNGEVTYLMEEELTGRRFYSTINNLKKIENNLYRQTLNNNPITVNDVMQELGLPAVTLGFDLGFTVDNELIIDIDSVVNEDDVPMVIVNFGNLPIHLEAMSGL